MTFQEFLDATYGVLRDSWVTESYLNPETHTKASNKYDRYSNNLTFSVTWSMGGNRGNCFNEGLSEVSAEHEPEFPKELDIILELIAPNVTFIQYKGIVMDVTEVGEKYHSDYYGGSTTEGFKGFNVKKLYDVLVKRELI